MGNMQAYYSPIQWETQGKGYEYKYDYLERVIDTITPLRSHERVFRSFDGDITREIHPVSYAEKGENGDGTRYEYDKDGNCIRIRYADGGTERRFYDADGNMTKQVLPEAYDAGNDDGAGYSYTYDCAGRLTQIQDPDGNVLHTYAYNGAGQTIRETDGKDRRRCMPTMERDSLQGRRPASAGKEIPPTTALLPIPMTAQAIRLRKPTDSRRWSGTTIPTAGTESTFPMTRTAI